MSSSNNYKGGSFPGQDLFFVDGDQSIAEPVGIPRISFPLEGDSKNSTAALMHPLQAGGANYLSIAPYPAENLNSKCFIIEQDFKVAADWFIPLALDTPYDISFSHDYVGPLLLASAILVSEGPQQDIGGGFVKWTRCYVYMDFATGIPGPFGDVGCFVWNDYESIPFTFPGIAADVGSGAPGTDPFSDEVDARVERIFFVDDGFHRPFRALGFYPFSSAFGPQYPIDFVSPDSQPDDSTYLGWTVSGDEIVVRPSIFRRWRGNIYEMVTYYAPAE